jgi:hypothetical protein
MSIVWVYVRIYTHIHMCIHLNICIYIHIYTYSLKESKTSRSSLPLGVYGVKKVHPAIDVPISHTTTIAQLYHIILAFFPHLNSKPYRETESNDLPIPSVNTEERNSIEPSFPEGELISVAKGSATGPPLTLKSSLQLTWDSPLFLSSISLQIDHPSLGLDCFDYLLLGCLLYLYLLLFVC